MASSKTDRTAELSMASPGFKTTCVNKERLMGSISLTRKRHRLMAKANALKRLQAETAAELGALLPSILDQAFKGEL